MLKDKLIILGVTGGIAAYKSANLASLLIKQGAKVQVIMTKNATEFISPLTFEGITNRRCCIDTFDRNHEYSTEHISLAKAADGFVIAPATANVIGKIANGLADDMLTTTFMACGCNKIIVPAMNTGMYNNPINQENLKKLSKFGIEIITPQSGRLACGDIGIGKMQEPETIMQYIIRDFGYEKDLVGKNILVTAGATQEKLDPVRYITNHSTGKMGYNIAKVAAMRGANVTLVTGKTNIEKPFFVDIVSVFSAKEMYDAVMSLSDDMDIIIKAAAVADYRPSVVSDNKIKKSDNNMVIQMQRTDDILKQLGTNKKSGQFICGFSMETENMIENSKKKLVNKNVDMIVANNLEQSGAGFGTDTNVVTIITENQTKQFDILTKQEVAEKLLNEIIKLKK